MAVGLTLRSLTGGSVALALWLLADGKTIVQVKMTQAEYDAWGSFGVPPNSPAPGATFFLAMGGISALNTADGFAHTGDAWIDPRLGPMIATSENYDFGFNNVIASDPGTTKQSLLTGIVVGCSGNRFRPALLDAQTLTTFDVTTAPPSPISVVPISVIIPNSKSVSFDSASGGNVFASATLTVVGVVANRRNRYVTGNASYDIGGGVTLNSVQWNGTGLTSRSSQVLDALTNVDYWDLTGQVNGSFNMVWTLSAGNNGISVGMQSFYGVDQSSPRRNLANNTGNSTAPTVGVISAVGDMVASIVGIRGGIGTLTPDATWITDILNAGSFDPSSTLCHIAGSAGTVTRTDAISGAGQTWAAISASIRAAVTAPVGGFIAPQLLW